MRLGVALLACAPVHAATPASTADARMERGAHALRTGDVEGAITSLESSLALDPDRPAALALYAEALLSAGLPADARAALERLRAADPDAPDLDYLLGLTAYRLAEWDAADTHLGRARGQRPEDGLVCLLHGVALQALGRYDDAERAFDEAERRSPELADRLAYRRGLLAIERRQWDEARDRFAEVEARLPGSPLAESAAVYRARIDRLEGRRWSAFGRLGLAYDSNVNLGSDDDFFGGTERDDGFGIAELGGSFAVLDEEYATLRVGQTGSFSLHFDETDFDDITSRTWVHARAPAGPLGDWLSVTARYTFEYVWIDTERFRSTHAVEPALEARLGEANLTRLFGRLENRNYFEDFTETFDRDGNVWRAGIDQYRVLPESRFGENFARIGYRYRVEDTQGSDFDADGHELVATLGVALPWRVRLLADGRYEWREFDGRSSIGEDQDLTSGHRVDRIARTLLSLQRPVGEHMRLDLGYGYTNRASNDDFFDYERHVVEFVATYSF